MGNLFGRKQEQEIVNEIVGISNGSLTEENVYEIIMKSNCNFYSVSAKEILTLHEIFAELDTESRVMTM